MRFATLFAYTAAGLCVGLSMAACSTVSAAKDAIRGPKLADMGRNTILHTQIAEARIAYGGRGDLSRVQRTPPGQALMETFSPF